MRLLICTATAFEMAPIIKHLESKANKISFFEYKLKNLHIYPLVTGVGSMQTAFALARFKDISTIDLALNVGVAGAFNREIELTEVVEVTKDRFSDLGVEEADGTFSSVFDLELDNPNKFPFQNGWINNQSKTFSNDLLKVSALTVNKVSGTQESIDKLQSKHKADLETMEGAAFLYACKILDVDAIQLRAVSNYVEVRNRANWKIDEALVNLNKVTIEFIEKLSLDTI